ncbi:hypothetical protein OROMI_003495 [Orobanche minor]
MIQTSHWIHLCRPCLELKHVKRIEKLLDESGVVKDIGGGLGEQTDAALCCQESGRYEAYQHHSLCIVELSKNEILLKSLGYLLLQKLKCLNMVLPL